MELPAIRACLAGLKQSAVLRFRVRRLAQPELELQESEKAPECVARMLGRIPMPREILFQSVEEGHLDCYSSRLDIEADEVLGAKVPTSRVEVRVDLPLALAPQDDASLARMLAGWALTPFWSLPEGKSGAVSARIVPSRMCLKCLGKEREDPNEAFDTHPGSWPP